MDRRKSLQTLLLGTGGSALVFYGCTAKYDEVNDQTIPATQETNYFGRTQEELERIEKLQEEQLFSEHEMATIRALSNVILPPREPYGGPVDGEVPEFIEFIGKDIPELQNILLGGLMWLDHDCNSRFNKEFKTATTNEQKQVLDPIAYHDIETPLENQLLEIQFFHLMRNLVITGYYTSKLGIADLGYKGNQPNVWDGVPQDVLDQHGMVYEDNWISKCIDQSKRNVIAEWDENGNLLT